MLWLTWKIIPLNAWSIPRVLKTILQYSLKITIGSPNWIHFWNPIQYLEKMYWLDLMGSITAKAEYGENVTTYKKLAVKFSLVPMKSLNWLNS